MSRQKRRRGRLAGGGGMGRRQNGRLACVVLRLRCSSVGGLNSGGVGTLSLGVGGLRMCLLSAARGVVGARPSGRPK